MTENQAESPETSGTETLPGSRIGPYRILSCLGRGGMGVVYLAERADEEFSQRVAIKVAYSSHGESLSRRFRSERQILAQLSHPYIARLLDGGTTGGGHPYFVMDYIEGLPIDEHCDDRRLSIDDRLALFRRVCSAVQYAHRKRVVHRDIKPPNILVTEEGIPQLLDFGIAKLLDPGAFSLTVEATETRQHPMTPSYASPEQILGQTISERSDLYSLGALLYRLLTGQLPYRLLGLSQIEIEHLITTTEPTKPSLAVESAWKIAAKLGDQRGLRPQELRRRLAGDLDNITMTALAKEPERRYGSADELSEDVLRFLESRPVRARPQGWSYRLRRRLRRHRTSLAATALALMAVTGAYFLGSSRAPKLDAAIRSSDGPVIANRHSVAVFDLASRSDDDETAWISTALADMLSTELRAGEQLQVLSGALVSRMRQDLALPPDQPLETSALSRVRDYLGVDRLVFGSYEATATEIRVRVSVQDAVSGRSLGTWAESGLSGALGDLAMRLGERLREGLDVSLPPNVDPAEALSSHPLEPEAARLYAQGLRQMRLFDFLSARRALERAVELDPGSAVVHSALATTYMELGNDLLAAKTARRAFELAGNLPTERKRLLEGQALEAAMDWAGAAKIYRALTIVFPDSLEYRLRLAEVETFGGKPSRALQTLAELRQQAGDRSDPRIDLAEARACRSRGDLKRQLAAATRAADHGERLGAEQLVAKAHLLAAESLHSMGRYSEAAEAVAKARDIFTRRNDQRGLAEALVSQVDPGYPGWRRDLGVDFDDAVEIFRKLGDRRGEAKAMVLLSRERLFGGQNHEPDPDIREQLLAALHLAREIGSRRVEAEALNYLGVYAFFSDSTMEESLDWFEKALTAAEESGDQRLVAGFLINVANILVALDEVPPALERYDQAISIAREIESRYVLGLALVVTRLSLVRTGQLNVAQERVLEALEIARETNNHFLLDLSLRFGMDVAAQLGDEQLVLKRRDQVEDLIRLGVLEDSSALESSLAGAWVSLGEPEKAEGVAREIFAKRNGDVERLLLTEILVDQEKLGEAREIFGPLFDKAERPLLPEYRSQRLRLAAILEAAAGQGREARRRLENHIARSEERELTLFAFEGRLALGRVLLLTGDTGEARGVLGRLADEAGELGYVSLRRRALQWRKRAGP